MIGSRVLKVGDVIQDKYVPDSTWDLVLYKEELHFRYIGTSKNTSWAYGQIVSDFPYTGQNLGDNWELVVDKSDNFKSLYDKLNEV